MNNDGLLDLFIVNYLLWDLKTEHLCGPSTAYDYCSPKFYEGQPNQLFLNRGKTERLRMFPRSGGIRQSVSVGKGMGVGVADFDLDGRPDLFVTNDTSYNYLFHNTGKKFEEVAFQQGVALVEDGQFISGMGLDFRDYNNDGFPDITFVALNSQTFPIYRNKEGKGFEEVTYASGMRQLSRTMAGYGAGFFDFDNDGWKDLFVSRGHVERVPKPGVEIEQPNTVFRNLGTSGKWMALTERSRV